MIIDQFTSYPFGGAGAAAVRHHLEMRRQNVDSRLFVKDDVHFEAAMRKISADQIGLDDLDPRIEIARFLDLPGAKPSGLFAARRERRRRKRVVRQYERHLQNRSPQLELFSSVEQYDRTRINPLQVTGDIVNLHWISYFLDLPSFMRSVPVERPIVWTLHDMNTITGGCHYSGRCHAFTRSCGNCPLLDSPAGNDLSYGGLRARQQALAGRKLTVVSPSRWLQEQAQRSVVWPDQTEFRVIHYGFDTETFKPIETKDARCRLVLPVEPTIIAFGADDVGNPRKGFGLLKEALAKIRQRCDVQLMVFGQTDLADIADLDGVHVLGYIDQPRVQALAYAAADLFIMPSLEDNLPQTGLEAMACGTPVVGFDTGGVPDYVLPGQTGLLAKKGDAESLAARIIDLIEQPRLRQQLAAGARKLIETDFELARQTKKYLQLYSEILDRSATRRRAA